MTDETTAATGTTDEQKANKITAAFEKLKDELTDSNVIVTIENFLHTAEQSTLATLHDIVAKL